MKEMKLMKIEYYFDGDPNEKMERELINLLKNYGYTRYSGGIEVFKNPKKKLIKTGKSHMAFDKKDK